MYTFEKHARKKSVLCLPGSRTFLFSFDPYSLLLLYNLASSLNMQGKNDFWQDDDCAHHLFCLSL